MKRTREDAAYSEQHAKSRRVSASPTLFSLSEELLVRILSFVPVPTLLVCQLICKKLNRLAVDSELWKAAYYKRFVLPRAARIPGIKETPLQHLRYSSKLAKWLNDGHLLNNGRKFNWKHQYRLRHNWSKGSCAVSEIVVAQPPSDPPLLAVMSNNAIYTADSTHGIRAWDSKNGQDFIAARPLFKEGNDIPQIPTSITVDTSEENHVHERIAVGFDDGSFNVFTLAADNKVFELLFAHPPSTNGALTALAFSSPYLLSMTQDHLLSIYAFPDKDHLDQAPSQVPKLIYSLKSHTVWPPASLSIRTTPTTMIAAIAYALPTYLSGWTIGVQEMRFSRGGELLESRLATAADGQSFTLSGQRSMSSPSTRSSSPFAGGSREPSFVGTASNSKPTSMSYSHPYLLVAHPDNTLALYLVKSTSSLLSISAGSRLWGHTSSVSGTYVGVRGKAVSVSRLGDELRVWDLESGISSMTCRRRVGNEGLSVRVQPAKSDESTNNKSKSTPTKHSLRLALDEGFDDATISKGWVGFDEQNVIVLREKGEGSQVLVVHDFS
ncbi:hypothetical protein DM02DRAFT_578860 [Periconia macrospinosa]|uniref:F-box domain-containing protein n=1 Tax=Periconia macrospinosa TaxID=97972 RepID=A0A2V1EF01_9PLEO|nr:hypothetical protein DM02DRAFT_578860 [Periconia macrospinosa]